MPRGPQKRVLSRKDPQESLKSKMTLLHQMSNKNESLFASRSQRFKNLISFIFNKNLPKFKITHPPTP
jgi:hypothetical protein